ncbi:hypothetical protein SETIT_8G131200v2 [Setaria italica]|uniref:Uncharacterized protein n=1 Tax=Setaria italica TaxID=4555 RepID=A0A368S786_SETIT|nr:hypothetical protein SETIT_8G131200v2 [Setaria italica]
MPGLAANDSSPPAAPPPLRAKPKKPTPAALGPEADESLDNPDLGPFLLKQARGAMVSGEGGGTARALEFAARALERRGEGAELELAMSLHVAATIHCGLRRHADTIPVLERAVAVRGEEWSLAAFSGWMQHPNSHRSYLAEAHVQALQFDEAEKLCRKALEIHREHSATASLEEASDCRLMALILDAKGDYDGALEHLVLASMTTVANGRDIEVATIDVAIGNTYLALARFDEAVFSYQKALTVLKSARGDDHPTVASVYVRLADLYHRTGRLRESKSYCENALGVYAKPAPGAAPDEIAGGLMEIAAIYEALGQWSTVAGIEAQMGVLYYMIGRCADSRNSFESAVAKLRASVCVQLFKIDEAAQLFEEARAVLEQYCGASHPDTLGVYSNLAAIYDAMGRVQSYSCLDVEITYLINI